MSPDPTGPAGIWELLRSNRDLRRLWLASVVSHLGDWFNTIALYTLVSRLTGSPLALGVVFLVKSLPLGLASPIAGLLVDRWNRRWVMIGSDLLRAAIVLAFLLVRGPGDVPLLYALIAAQMVVGSVFEPARSASIPNVTTPRELLAANALGAASWSVMLALGAALGGFATDAFGESAVFVIDSATYLVSALFVAATRIPQHTDPPERGSLIRLAVGNIVDGWRYLRRVPRVGRVAFAKACWSLAGGGLVYMLALLGEAMSPAAVGTGVGLLFAVRGLGTGVGPLVARRLFPQARRWMFWTGLFVAASGALYGLVAVLPWTLWITIAVFLAHATSGANWVFSTVLLQQRSEDRYRGRVFATEWLTIMGADTVSVLAASFLLQSGVLDLRGGFGLFAGIQVLCGLAWLAVVVPAEARDAAIAS